MIKMTQNLINHHSCANQGGKTRRGTKYHVNYKAKIKIKTKKNEFHHLMIVRSTLITSFLLGILENVLSSSSEVNENQKKQEQISLSWKKRADE